ncbi:unnamed protein product [Cylindrotheca closterium]|uniref:TauD/TfdA-like domain-containing protein n=1 Tax=Cylindrotheca closterium TaxID=2856 RepID=A0AAD2JPD0_9STRA|nr:unnamed protein product [Cylindrotheca closterium]
MMFTRKVARKSTRQLRRNCRHLQSSIVSTRSVSSTPQQQQQQDHGTDNNTTKVVKELPWQYLRASDPSNYDNETYQRTDVVYNMENGKPSLDQQTDLSNKPSLQQVDIDDDKTAAPSYQLQWSDGTRSDHPIASLQDEYNRWQHRSPETRVLWSRLTEGDLRGTDSPMTISYNELVQSDQGMKFGLQTLYQYGILLVTETPLPDSNNAEDDGAGIAALGAALGGGKKKTLASNSVLVNYKGGETDISLPHATDGPLRTLYGTVWSTVSEGQTDGASVADSAYGQDALPLHTDMTYLRDPPGLQIFTMVQPAKQGGDSIFGDGFAMAQQLRESNPKAFEVLSQTVRRYRCKDDAAGWHLEAWGPVIQLCPRGHEIVGIRHNDLDRLPDLPPNDDMRGEEEVNAFYEELFEAHKAWDALLAKDESRLVIKLQPGETMVVANQRCMHGRYSFTSDSDHPRSVMGCYIGQDELYSRMRMEGLYLH